MSGQYASYSALSGSGGGGGVTSVTGTSPIASSGGATPDISIQVANGSQNGYLSSVDWTTFNSKQATITIGALDAQSANATGLALVSNVLSAQSADATHPGLVSTGTQTLAGAKTFSSAMNISAASTAALTINTSSFIFDSTNNRLGIGTAPAANRPIDILVDNNASFQGIAHTTYGTQSAGWRGRTARGTLAVPTAVTANMSLTSLSALGYGDTQFSAASVALIDLQAGATFTDTSNPTFIRFATTPSGSVTRAEAMRINSTGNVLIGSGTDNNTDKLQVTGSANITSLTASRAVVTDSTKTLASSATTAAELAFVSGVTSAIQTQIDGKQATGNYITALTGDVTASGPGSVAATIASGAITNAKVNAAAAIDYSKLALTGSIVNADIGTSAAIAFSKLAALTSAHILVGSAGNVATDVAVTGDISITNAGVTAYSGTVSVAKGGTGLTTLTANNVILGNGSSNVTFVAPSTSGNILTSNGTTWTSAAPQISAWTNYTPTVAGLGTVSIIYAQWRNVGSGSVEIRVAVTSGTVAGADVTFTMPNSLSGAISNDTLLMGNAGTTYTGANLAGLFPFMLNADKTKIQFGYNNSRSIESALQGNAINNGDRFYFTASVPV